MKKFILMLAILAGTFTYGSAQSKMGADTASRSKRSSAKAAKDMTGKADDGARTKTASTGLNKDGSPDMRLKANKDAKAKQNAPAPTATQTSAPPPPPVAASKASRPTAATASPANISADKVVGKDAKGRTIYEGPRNGQYVLSANGSKEYIKKTN